MKYFAIVFDKLKPVVDRRTGCALFAVMLLSVLHATPWANWLEKYSGLTWMFRLRGELQPPEDVVIVALNSASAERMGLSRHSYTWPRTVYAKLLNRLGEAQTELIVLDIAFRAPRDESEDTALETALANSRNVILYRYLKRIQMPIGNGQLDIEESIPPLERFAQHALASGFFVLPKTNNLIFTAPLFHNSPTGTEAAQPLLAYLALQSPAELDDLWLALTARPADPTVELEQRAKTLHKLASSARWSDIPPRAERLFSIFAQQAPFVINFYGDALTIPYVDIDTVLDMDADELAHRFDGKIVYVGYLESWQTEQQDAYATVFTSDKGVDISGVEISATVLANLQHGQYIRQAPVLWQWLTMLIFYSFGLVVYRLSASLNLIMQASLVGAYGTTVYLAFSQFYWWLPIGIPLLAIIAANGLQLKHHYQKNRKRLRDIRFALSQYLPEQAANSLSQNINTLEKEHQVVSGVVLMTDIKGYTRLSEQIAPDELHTLMNRYYECLVRCVKRHNGFVGNIVGDSLMALWTGPEINGPLCTSAYLCALDIQSELRGDREFAERLPTCAALHGGRFSLGNLGAAGHFEYSPVGDIINTSSRIEHFNRDVATELLVSAAIANILQNHHCDPPLRYLGAFNMRNKSAAVPLYTTALSNSALSKRFAQGVNLFQRHQFAAALDAFNALYAETHDGPSGYYAKACQQQIDVIHKPS